MLQVPHSKRRPLSSKCCVQSLLKDQGICPLKARMIFLLSESKQNYPIGLPGIQEMVYVLTVTWSMPL